MPRPPDIDVPTPASGTVPVPSGAGPDGAPSTAAVSPPAPPEQAALPTVPPLPPAKPPDLASSEAVEPPTPHPDPSPAASSGGSTDTTPATAAAARSREPEARGEIALPTIPPLPPAKPADLAQPGGSAKPDGTGDPSAPAKPAVEASKPAVAPSGATTAFDPRVPAPDEGCAARLKARGVVTEAATPGPQPDARCTVQQPVHLLSATMADGTSVSFPEKPTLACITADAFSAYVHDLLAPLARGTWGVAVTDVWTGPGLECRSRDHVFGAKLSAHGQGLAVDIAQLKLADGRLVAVGEPKTDRERDFETAARAGGCGYFHTVLGPGSDSYHRTHWHFDLEVRGREGDGKYCK